MNVITLIHSDYKKYKKYGGNFLTIVFFTQGFWAKNLMVILYGWRITW